MNGYTRRAGAWRSLVSALVWGTRGRQFESARPDSKAPSHGAFRLFRLGFSGRGATDGATSRTFTNTCSVAWGMTSQGTRYGAAHTAFRRALETRSVSQAELALREMGRVGLLDALDYCALLAVERSERFDPAAVRWLSVLLSECGSLTLDEVQLATACLQNLPGSDPDSARGALGALVKRRHRLHGQ